MLRVQVRKSKLACLSPYLLVQNVGVDDKGLLERLIIGVKGVVSVSLDNEELQVRKVDSVLGSGSLITEAHPCATNVHLLTDSPCRYPVTAGPELWPCVPWYLTLICTALL